MSKRKIAEVNQLRQIYNEQDAKVVFSSTYESNDLRLIELPNEIQTAIQNGESLGMFRHIK